MHTAPLRIANEENAARTRDEAQESRFAATEPAAARPPAPSAEYARSDAYARIVPGLAIGAALWWGQVVLIPLAVSILLSYALEPLLVFLERRGLRRPYGVPVVLLTLFCGVGAGVYVLRGEAVDFINRIPVAAHTVAQAIQGAGRATPGTVSRVQAAARELESATKGATDKDAADGVTAVRIEEPTFKWSDWLLQGSHSAVELGAQLVAVLCLLYCLMVAGDLFKRKIVRIVPSLSDKKITVEILKEIDRQIERFLVARVVISAVVGIAIWAAFRVIGLSAAGIWGVLAALLFSIPIVGPMVIVAAAAIAAFAQFGTLGMAAAAGGICVAIGALEGYVLTPWLMSRVGPMNATAVFVSLLFWGWVWGIWGLLLAVPIMAAAKAVSDRVPDFSAFAELLSE